ncbi:MAG: DUF2065 domain-containing protein [Rhodospirillales bacterium]|nr:DUF2065 domain-containing protein [Rhodospirillales bacterium]
MTDFLTALALAVAIEGMLYALFPEGMKRMMLRAIEASPQVLRVAGLAAAVAGVALVAVMRNAAFSP